MFNNKYDTYAGYHFHSISGSCQTLKSNIIKLCSFCKYTYVEVIKGNWFKIFQAPIRKDQLNFAHLSSYNR